MADDFAGLVMGTAFVQVSPTVFVNVVAKMESPLVVTGKGGIISTTYQYLTSYKGITFYAKSSEPLFLPSDAEILIADSFWLPSQH